MKREKIVPTRKNQNFVDLRFDNSKNSTGDVVVDVDD
jgi:hypothetical protein